MNKIIIIADSTCDLSLDLIKEYDIKIVPLHVSFKGDSTDYLDGVTITREEVYKKCDELGITPTTGARNVNELINDIKYYISNNFVEKEKYAKLREKYFKYQDRNNCKRTYDIICSKRDILFNENKESKIIKIKKSTFVKKIRKILKR